MLIGWINTDIAFPAYYEQIVKVKVADFTKDYIAEGYYNHNERRWYIIKNDERLCVNDNVYAWKIKSQWFKGKNE